MSPFKVIMLWFGRLVAESRSQSVDPDAMSLRDWADLPAHHPHADAGCAALKP